MDTLYLIDGSNLIFRAYHAMPPMSNSKGAPTGAIFGFIHMLLRLDDNYHPSHVAILFDAGGKSVRTEMYDQYKAHRPPCPEDLPSQMQAAKQIASALGFQVIDAIDAEADDVIAALTKQAQAHDIPVVIVSSDKDLMQLCTEKVHLLDTMKNEQGKLYGPKEVEEKFGVTPSQLGDVLALIGDAVDNVPGVPGIGPKTAAQLIQKFGNVEELLKNIDHIEVRGAAKIKEALRTNETQLRLSRQLVSLHDHIPVSVSIEGLLKKNPDLATLEDLLKEYEFRRFFARFFPGKEAQFPSKETASLNQTSASVEMVIPVSLEVLQDSEKPQVTLLPTHVITQRAQLEEWLSHIKPYADFQVAISLQFTGVEREPVARVTPVCGIGLFAQRNKDQKIPNESSLAKNSIPVEGTPIYLPLSHLYLGMPVQWDLAELRELLQPLFSASDCAKFVYGIKDTYLALENLGFFVQGVVSDPSLCSYLLDAGQKHDLLSLKNRYLQVAGLLPKTREELCRSGRHVSPLESIEVESVANVAGFETQTILELGRFLKERLSAKSLSLLENMELPLGHVLAKIERYGILLDLPVLTQLSEEISQQLKTLEAEVNQQAGYEINIASPKQLQELLFEKLKLPGVKKTKTGLSTDAEVLEALASQHPVVKMIHTHRTLAKLKNTYLDQFPKLMDPQTGRLHTSYNQVVAATGRLSSSEPNLQNIPIRSELGNHIRRAFVAPKGMVLLSADYSQIELRVLAHLSQDPLLMKSFLHHEDVHERTAIEMFGPVDGQKSEMRRVAKMINYGIVYGLSEHGLSTRLSISRSTAKQYIEEYFSRYSRLTSFMDELIEKARKEGGARTALGRFRPIPELYASQYQVRAYGERMAKNTPIQGTSADILKQAMINVQNELEAQSHLRARMLLTVHDELVLETPIEHQEEVILLAKTHMERAATLSVPLEVAVCAGANWAECK